MKTLKKSIKSFDYHCNISGSHSSPKSDICQIQRIINEISIPVLAGDNLECERKRKRSRKQREKRKERE